MPANPPRSAEDALARGYRPSGDLKTFRRAQGSLALTAAPKIDCNTAAQGTLCFDEHEPDGGHVVGYCDGNGICQLYTKPGG